MPSTVAPNGGLARKRLAWVAAGLLLLVALLAALRFGMPSPLATVDPVDAHARRFVQLALSLGRIQEREVDAYSGPEMLRPNSADPAPSLETIESDLKILADGISRDPVSPRQARLLARTTHLRALVQTIRDPASVSFDEEAKRVYGMFPVPIDTEALARTAAELARLLPGPGPLATRIEAFRAHYVIPENRRRAVFDRALGECRARTRAHWPLPAGERLDIQWTGAVDAAWHRYLGDYRSRLQINPRAVAFLGSALDVACHEGYPGHHAQFVMQDRKARPHGLPLEERIVLLRSPDSMFREGAANYGVDLAFPADERLAFQRDVLFPLAGFAPAEAARFEAVRVRIDRLSAATVPILRDYRDGHLPAEAAAAALRREALVSSPEALLGFVDQLGPYVLGYTVARDWVAREMGGGDRWTALLAAVERPGITPRPGPPKDKP